MYNKYSRGSCFRVFDRSGGRPRARARMWVTVGWGWRSVGRSAACCGRKHDREQQRAGRAVGRVCGLRDGGHDGRGCGLRNNGRVQVRAPGKAGQNGQQGGRQQQQEKPVCLATASHMRRNQTSHPRKPPPWSMGKTT